MRVDRFTFLAVRVNVSTFGSLTGRRCALGSDAFAFLYGKVRYRGLAKNATRSFVALGLANIYLARHRLA